MKKKIVEGLTLKDDGTWLRDDGIIVKITMIGRKERVYYRGTQYFTHFELAKAFVPNPKKYKYVELIDDKKPITAKNLRWIKYPKIKIDQKIADKIRLLVKSGKSQSEVARHYGISRSMANRIVKGDRWA